jgi:hypothetical protein
VKADRRYIKESLILGAAVQSLNVAKGMRESVTRDANLIGRQPVKHKRVVGVRAVSN